MLTNDNYFQYVKAYLKQKGIFIRHDYSCRWLKYAEGQVYIDPEEWEFSVSPPTYFQLQVIPEAEVAKQNVEKTSIQLDVYTAIPTGRFPEGTLILVRNDETYGVYVYVHNSFELL